jgi:NAD(P)-dependent dehydrogenase (short-subunit alcohol dehydrogenase family)
MRWNRSWLIPNTTLQGVPLVELAVEQFSRPIATYTRSYFLTARLAARRMVAKRSGVIMTVTSIPSRTAIPLMGGVAPAMSAVEALTRDLASDDSAWLTGERLTTSRGYR